MNQAAGSAASRAVATLDHHADFEAFRDAVRRLVHAGIAPRDVTWRIGEGESELFDDGVPVASLRSPSTQEAVRAPKAFHELARTVICHKASERFELVHRLLVRLAGTPQLLSIASDADVAAAESMAKNVRRCSHKMKAFVRFRETQDADGTPRYVAWFEPEHHTVDFTAPFFTRRFANMRWSILTPLRSAHWDGARLILGEGASRDVAPDGDVNEELWRTYFGAIFNPARLKLKAMQTEMPKRYWKNMPEADLIEPLIRQATDRTSHMIAAPSVAPARSTRVQREREAQARAVNDLLTDIHSLGDLAEAARHCERCPLYGPATQVVVGEGPPDAPLMFVGEQPGDQEDIAGRPFVGPAGQLFDRALADAGIPRDATFVTNAVKHFKFTPRGKRRIHQKPDAREVDICRFWLDEERRLVAPKLTVALGATAARALARKAVTISKHRGEPLVWADGAAGFVTVHPSYLLRLPDPAAKAKEYDHFVTDLTKIRSLVS